MVRSLRHLTRNFEETDHIDQNPDFARALKRLPALVPRETAIVGVHLVEIMLERGLRRRFSHLTKKELQELFEGFGPLSSFSAKIKVAYAIGMIPSSVKKDLEIMKEIRNAFAHSFTKLDFNQPDIREICSSSFFWLEHLLALHPDEQIVLGVDISDPRNLFILECGFLIPIIFFLSLPEKKETASPNKPAR